MAKQIGQAAAQPAVQDGRPDGDACVYHAPTSEWYFAKNLFAAMRAWDEAGRPHKR